MTSTCPTCGTPSADIREEFNRTYPGEPVHVLRFRCGKSGCWMPHRQGDVRYRTFWDVTRELAGTAGERTSS